MKTTAQIIEDLKNIKAELNKDEKEIEALAEKKGLSIRLDFGNNYNTRCREFFPALDLDQHSNLFPGNGLESNARDIERIINNPEKSFLSLIRFQDVDLKKQTFTIYGDRSYYLYKLSFFPGFPKDVKDHIKLVKEFQNGKKIFSFDSPELFNAFLNLINYTTPETERIISLITEETKKEFKEHRAKKTFNEFYFINQLARDEEVRSGRLNYYKIKQQLL